MKTRCAMVLMGVLMIFLAAGCGNAGSTEEIQDSAADLVVFSDIDAFAAYALSAEKEEDAAELVRNQCRPERRVGRAALELATEVILLGSLVHETGMRLGYGGYRKRISCRK